MFLDIHLEAIDDNGAKLLNFAKTKKLLAISLVPILTLPHHKAFGKVYPKDYFYPDKIIDILKELKDENNIVWGQQGFTHYCPDCFDQKDRRDPWHENRCLYQNISLKAQKEIMSLGKETIQEKLGITPTLYVPPNHQFNQDTITIAQLMEYKYFGTQAILNFEPYQEGEMRILPERKIRKHGQVFYTHYDQIPSSFNGDKPMSTSLDKISYLPKKSVLALINQKILISKKRLRDFKKRF